MHSSKDAARMELRASTRHANPYSFPPTPGSGLLGSTTRTASHRLAPNDARSQAPRYSVALGNGAALGNGTALFRPMREFAP